MKTSFVNVNGIFPEITAKNSTSDEAKDGTPLNDELFNEFFGILQAVVDQGNITPSGTTEFHDDSDFVNGIRNIAGSPGEIVYKVNYNSADAILRGERLLPLNGSTVLVSNYPELTEYAYCGDTYNVTASGFFRCNNPDGSNRNISGIYLYIPDYRGYFIRCAGGTENGIDVQVRSPHGAQDHGIKDHSHYITDATGPSTYYMNNFAVNQVSGSTKNINFGNTPDDRYFAAESPDTNENETRPINRNVYAYVRY